MILVILSLFIIGCIGSKQNQQLISLNLAYDKKSRQIDVAAGTTVQEALRLANVNIEDTDRIEPVLDYVLTDNTSIKVTRINTEYFTEQEVIPFDHQELYNEAIPEGEQRLNQAGVNGLKEITYKRVYEDGIVVSTAIINTVIVQEAIPEIVISGTKSSFASVDFTGKIAYISGGNAWIINQSTNNRQLVVPTGDLDGRIFSMSRDKRFLLFTRYSTQEKSINNLWLAKLQTNPASLVDLRIKNVVQFAQFDPSSNMIAYSTAEWSATAPGWQSNNDLYIIEINENGIIRSTRTLLEPNSGGLYGWWGTKYIWSPDGKSFLYSRPDCLGIFEIDNKVLNCIYNFPPYQPEGDWAWIPDSAWAPDMKAIYSVGYISDSANIIDHDRFDLIAIPLNSGTPIHLVEDVGMFAAPVVSPVFDTANFLYDSSGAPVGQSSYTIAYLQSSDVYQSETSTYQLYFIDRDGSNKSRIQSNEDENTITPQNVIWSPEPEIGFSRWSIAFLLNGNLWFVDIATGQMQRITSDGLINQIDWR